MAGACTQARSDLPVDLAAAGGRVDGDGREQDDRGPDGRRLLASERRRDLWSRGGTARAPSASWARRSGTTTAPQTQQASDDRDQVANQTASHHGPATAGVCLRIHFANRRSYRVQRVVSTTRAR